MTMKRAFFVRKTMCKTCIYRPSSMLNLEELEEEVKDGHGFFVKYRVCHSSGEDINACCRGFWNNHKDTATPTQIARRLNLVKYSDE